MLRVDLYPPLVWYEEGKFIPFNKFGKRFVIDDVTQFVIARVGEAVVELTDLEYVSNSDGPILVFWDNDNGEAFREFSKVARDYAQPLFYWCIDENIKDELGVESDSYVSAFGDGELLANLKENDFDVKNIKRIIARAIKGRIKNDEL